MWNPFKSLQRKDWILWGISCLVLLLSNIFSGKADILHYAATLTGATFLIFLAKGNVWGQILTILFSILYGIISLQARYWSELITYVGMTMPMAFLALISWLRHPYEQNDREVKIARLHAKQILPMIVITTLVTAVFSFILAKLNTPNLIWGCLSIATSFLAVYLTFLRSSWYAVAYAANDLVLIILWLLLTLSDFSHFPMVINFVIFFINDCYGFISWKKREQEQQIGLMDES